MIRLDSYNLRARLLPGLLGILPAIVSAILTVSWNQLAVPQIAATVLLAVLFVGFSDFARRLGKAVEPKLYRAAGGKPSVRFLRYRDTAFDDETKSRYRSILADRIGETPPTEEEETQNPAAADAFYERCGTWLRENTRNTDQFKVLHEENITYGFRRNLYGLKWPAIWLDILTLIACAAILHPDRILVESSEFLSPLHVVTCVTVLHAIYFLFIVTRSSVLQAADQYGRQLILTCEALRAPR